MPSGYGKGKLEGRKNIWRAKTVKQKEIGLMSVIWRERERERER